MVRYFPLWLSIGTVIGMGHLLGYARASTTDQDASLQADALRAAGCYRVFVDTISGALEHRPEFDKGWRTRRTGVRRRRNPNLDLS